MRYFIVCSLTLFKMYLFFIYILLRNLFCKLFFVLAMTTKGRQSSERDNVKTCGHPAETQTRQATDPTEVLSLGAAGFPVTKLLEVTRPG